MTRPLAIVALLALPAVASAQGSRLVPVGPPMLGGRVVTGTAIGDAGSSLFPVQVATPPRFSVGGGAIGGYPQVWLPSGSWGGTSYAWPVIPVVVQQPAPVRKSARSVTPVQRVALEGEAEATLVVQFPEPAQLWVDGKKRDGEPATEWTLTSPTLTRGDSYTFEVKGVWKSGSKTLEASRSVTVAAGERNRWVIVSGTEVKK